MISDALTNLTNPTVTDTAGAFNTIFGGWFVFVILLATFIVLAISIYSWSQDIKGSLMNAGYIISITAFLLSLARTSSGTQLITFGQALWFMIITALLVAAKKLVD